MNDIKFNFVFLGQSVLRYEVPLEIFHTINAVYESNFTQLAPANKQLVGKIRNEHSIYYDGEDTSKMHRHSLLPVNVQQWFMSMFQHYLNWLVFPINRFQPYEYVLHLARQHYLQLMRLMHLILHRQMRRHPC